MSFWYALFVKSGDEDNIRGRLEYCLNGNLRVFVPKREVIERKAGKLHRKLKVLFPGYVFLNGILEDSHVKLLYDVPNFYKILLEGGKPAIIPTEEIDIFKHLMVDDLITISNVIMEGDQVVIVDGPLLSLKGKILRVDKRKGRAKVAIEFLGEVRCIDLGIRFIAQAD